MKSIITFLSVVSAVSAFSTPKDGFHFAPPSTTGGMANLSIKDDPRTPLGKQWTSKMDITVKSGSTAGESKVTPYGTNHQANGRGGMGPLGQKWTTQMDLRVSRNDDKPLHFKPYGMDNQANGKGGRGPLGKEWTTKMDKTVPTKSYTE
jgi:hypothetical protein